METIYIKNMVCPRCIESVKKVCDTLEINAIDINLGLVKLEKELSSDERITLSKALHSNGFELLESQNTKIINKIKSIIIEQIHYKNEALTVNFSSLLSEKLNQEYSYLSRLFSSEEGLTIERFIVKQKIEKVKGLIFNKEFTLSEIAHQMNYSSVAHLSSQFKKETGLTPSEFKNLSQPNLKPLDSL